MVSIIIILVKFKPNFKCFFPTEDDRGAGKEKEEVKKLEERRKLLNSRPIALSAAFTNQILLAILTWLSTARPDQHLQLLHHHHHQQQQDSTSPDAARMSSFELARLMGLAWPKMFLVGTVERLLQEEQDSDGRQQPDATSFLEIGRQTP